MTRARIIVLYLLRSIGVFAFTQWLTRKRLRILCYHGFSIGDEYEVAPFMFMRGDVFDARMKTLKRRRIPVVSLDEAIKKLQENTIENAEAVITLDDGWSSNLTIGLPILKKYGFPACVYITTEHLGGPTEVFNVVLTYMILRSTAPTLELSGIHSEVDGSYPIKTDYRRAVMALIHAAEKAFPMRERVKLLRPIATALGFDLDDVLRNDRFRLMDAKQLIELQNAGIDIQLHTHTHRLPERSFDSMAHEINENRDAVQALLGGTRNHFCYPSGKYTAQHPEWLRKLGVVSATTCDPGHNPGGAPPLLLKRFLDHDDCSSIEFEAEIAGVKECLRMLREKLKGPSRGSLPATVPD